MNCELAQRRLLAADSPGTPSAETRRHLAECPSCRVWHRRLAQLEQQLPLLITPPSQHKADVVRLILNAPAPAQRNGIVPKPPARRSLPKPMRERGLRKVSVAIALAAALVVFALGWALVPTKPQTHPSQDPLAARRLQREQLLREAHTPQERLEKLAKLADGVHKEAVRLSQLGDADTANVADFFVELVRDNLLEQANQLPPEERQPVLTVIAEQLRETDSSISQLLGTPGEKLSNRRALEKMALEARRSRDQLLVLMRHDA